MADLYLKAGAGSGKTYRLTHDLAERMTRKDAPVDASRIILTTFTKAAAAEFVWKAREVLIKDCGAPDKAAELDGALIGTVHSVCERFVRKYWYRLGLTLPLNILASEDKAVYVSQAADEVATEDDVKYFAAFAEQFEMSPDFWKQTLKAVVENKYSFGIGDLGRSCEMSCDDIAAVFSLEVDERAARDTMDGFLRLYLSALEADYAKKASTAGKERIDEVRKLLGSPSLFHTARLIAGWIDPDGQKIDRAKKLWNALEPDTDLIDVHYRACTYLVSAGIGRSLQECVRRLFAMAARWEDTFRQFKKDNRLLDFNDMEQLFLRLLEEEDFEDVRRDISNSFDLLRVDEFQDSNPVQIRIFRRLKALIGDSMFVGDEKQAIYGFRGTDSALVNEFIESDIHARSSLRQSRRSRPALVEAANDTFCQAYGKTRLPVDPDNEASPYDGLSLHPVRTELGGLGPALQHWFVPVAGREKNDYRAVARRIRHLVDSGGFKVVKTDRDGNEAVVTGCYGDIAILRRNGPGTDEVVKALREEGVPVSVQEKDFLGWAEVQLLLSLVRYVADPSDAGARADIRKLIGGIPTEQIIRDGAAGDTDSARETADPLFVRLDAIRDRIRNLSVSEIIDSLILEMDLYGNVPLWGSAETRRNNIGLIAGLARQYEQICTNMNMSPSPSGFLDYVSAYSPEGYPSDKNNTVKVLTCHSAKGLEWPMVILDELDSLQMDDKELWKKELAGVRHYRKGDEAVLHLFPTILKKETNPKFGSSGSLALPQPIMERMKELDFCGYVERTKIGEEKNLLYVGFTRARDYLVTLGNEKSGYSWLTLCGACGDLGLDGDGLRLWHNAWPSAVTDLRDLPEADREIPPITPHPWAFPEKKPVPGYKYLSPSSLESEAEAGKDVTVTEVFRGERIPHRIKGDDSAACGTCIHRIFAAYDPAAPREESLAMAGRLIDGMGLSDQLPSPEAVIDSAVQLYGWLSRTYGEGRPLRELPFSAPQPDGSVLRGEMDLVWELPDRRCVLVDYKSYHGIEDFDHPAARDKYYGYAPQLKAYRNTLQAAGLTVTDTLVYYHIQGRVLRFGFGG